MAVDETTLIAYREILPAPPLRPFVECYWIRRAGPAPSRLPHRVLPDGCIDILFDLDRSSAVASVVGTMTRPLLVAPDDDSNFLGVRFRPGCAPGFLFLVAHEITDDRVALGELSRIEVSSLEEQLLRETTDVGRIHLLDRTLLSMMSRFDPDQLLDEAVRVIVRSRGRMSIDRLSTALGTSRQNLGRRFRNRVGISPKHFGRVIRFRHALATARRLPEIDWADLALASGYYDQAHLIRDFHQLAGTSPARYLAT